MIIRNANKILQENDRLRQENAKLKDDLERVRRDYRTLKTASMPIPAVTNTVTNNIRDASDEVHIQITSSVIPWASNRGVISIYVLLGDRGVNKQINYEFTDGRGLTLL